MKKPISALSGLALLLAGCSTATPTATPTAIDGPSPMATPAAVSEPAAAPAPTSPAPAASASTSSASGSAGSTSTAGSKPAASTKPKPTGSEPATVVSSEDKDTKRDGGPIDIAPSVDGKEGTSVSSTGSFISVTKKEGGKGTIKLAGKADVPEGTVIATAVHKTTGTSTTEFTTASCSMGCTGDWSISFSGLSAGDYTVTLTESDDSDGEGKGPFTLTVPITVK